jgi:hypothetical protein
MAPQEDVSEDIRDDVKSKKPLDKIGEFSNEKVIFILNRYTGLAPYSHEFVANSQDPQMLSGFISAMGNFMGEVSGNEEVQWKTVYGADSSIIVEGGEWALGVLAVERENTESKSKVRLVVKEFEDSFAYLRDANSIEGGIYAEFDKYVRRIFIDSKLTNRSILLKPSEWAIAFQKAGIPNLENSGMKELYSINLEETSRLMQKSFDDAKELVAQIVWTDRLGINFIPADDELLALSEGSSRILFSRIRPVDLNPSTIMVLGALDGRRTISAVMDSVSVKNKGVVLNELGFLINSGYVERISLERRLVLFNECVLSELLESCIRELGPWKGKQFLLWAIGAVIKQNPWVSRLRLTKSNRVMLIFDDYLGPLDLDEIYSTMDRVTNLIEFYFAKEKGKTAAQRIAAEAKRRCNRTWSSYLSDISF